ncbi:hypothetical protein PVAG01_10954 [Phlyctema vagabunda]|uniref:Actin-like ATPase domain-containing protein n=1 Tax=Phlyctema vagabunda TaxID=108571 RepID=A0ABR4P3R3_9HELO
MLILFISQWAPSIRRDFGELASRVLKDISPNSQVFSSLTEAEASCAYLVERLEFAPGTCAITCDIGGATTDIAAAILHDINGVLVPTNVFPTIYGSGVKINVSQIDHEFERYVGETYQEEAVDDSWWSEQRHGFDGSNDVPLWPRNNLSVNRNLEKLQLSARVISSAKMRGFFEEFLSDICGAIEAALQALNKNDMQNFPTAIALCGGGGTMKMLVQRLRERFSEFTIRVLPSTNESCLATIIGHRYHLMKLELSSYLDETSIGLSTGFSRVPITWRTASRLTCFNDSARGRKAKHLFISQPASAKGPISGSDVNDNTDFSAWPDTIIWELEVRLGKRWAETRYCIEVACTGRKTFSFRAFDAERPEKTYEIADVLRS